ncbi:MAG: DNA methyltransferase [bacterium]
MRQAEGLLAFDVGGSRGVCSRDHASLKIAIHGRLDCAYHPDTRPSGSLTLAKKRSGRFFARSFSGNPFFTTHPNLQPTADTFASKLPGSESSSSVFSNERVIQPPGIALPRALKLNRRLKMDGLKLLAKIPQAAIPVAFFDPQYRGVLDKMQYGNEGKSRSQRRCALEQMSEQTIAEFVAAIDRVLIPSGHLFLWVDKYHLCDGFRDWLDGTGLDVVDLVNWDKERIGMGYRSRRRTEYCVVLQKQPRKAKGVWKIHTIPDTWREKSETRDGHPHKKPIALQGELIAAVSNAGDLVVDPAAGGFSVLEAATSRGRNFLGCDLNG